MVNERPPVDGGTVLITGASAGIGREFAVQLARRAGTLVLLARRARLLDELRDTLLVDQPGSTVLCVPADLSEESGAEHALAAVREQAGPVDVLINNAGVGDQSLFDLADWGRTRTLLFTNIFAVTRLTAALVPAMVERGRGGILNIGSGAGLAVMPAAAAYSASKHFIDRFSEALRADLAGTGVVVTQVCPGPVESEFDTVAGSVGGMTGAPPPWLRISAAQCAREALAGFDRGQPLVFPGTGYRMMMHALPFAPRGLQRRRAARSAPRLRTRAAGGHPRPQPASTDRPPQQPPR
jgi:short-subunit dehydrogenase